MQRKGYWLGGVLDWVLDKGTKYAPLLKTGVAALSTYASWKDQQKKNEMQQGAYDDYMAQAAAAGHEAQAAIDVNLTPMTVSGVPTTKADITDFTPVAKGGLMTLPNKQRKRYYAGTGEEDIEVMDIDVGEPTPFDLQQETGVPLTDEQVKYNTGNPREGAWSVWNSGGIDQQLYEFDFEIFFDSGDWSDHLRGQAPVQENMQMASADPVLQDEYDKYVFDIQEQGGTPISIEQFREQAVAGQANGGIIGLRHGGRPGYAEDGFVTADTEGVVSEVSPSRKTQIEGNQLTEDAYTEIFTKFMNKFPNIDTDTMRIEDMIAMLQAEGVMETEDLGILGLDRSMDMITPESVDKSVQRISRGDTQYEDIPEEVFTAYEDYNKGGRIGYRKGGPDWFEPRIQQILEDNPDMTYDEAASQAYDEGHGGGRAQGGRIGYSEGSWESEWEDMYQNYKLKQIELGQEFVSKEEFMEQYQNNMATGGRIKKDNGGIMNLGGMEKDYRATGGFVPIGAYEKKDDVPARLSKNEFVMTADAVRAAGGGSINKGAQRMYDTMKHLEASPQAKRMTA